MKRKLMLVALSSCLCAGLSGCGLFGTGREAPVVDNYIGTILSKNSIVGTLSTDAAYRTAYIVLNGNENVDMHGRFCPEPPPDVSQSIAASFSGKLSGAVTPPAGQTGGSLAAEISRAIATEVAPLLRRSQGLQFYRDRAFYTCVAFLNKVISPEEYRDQMSENSKLAVELIRIEATTWAAADKLAAERLSAAEKLRTTSGK